MDFTDQIADAIDACERVAMTNPESTIMRSTYTRLRTLEMNREMERIKDELDECEKMEHADFEEYFLTAIGKRRFEQMDVTYIPGDGGVDPLKGLF